MAIILGIIGVFSVLLCYGICNSVPEEEKRISDQEQIKWINEQNKKKESKKKARRRR